ncbi:MAG: VWA domain-containing protein [bacterium]|nr:VWA domain-containing protein [bacterium]
MFANPAVLWLLLLLPLWMLFFAWRTWARETNLRRIGDQALVAELAVTISSQRRWLKSACWLGTVAAVIVALAQPRWGIETEAVQAQGISLLIVMDVSASMDAEDVQPSRIERAKFDARRLFEAAAEDEVGLILFAGSAFVQFPLTVDTTAAVTFLDAVSTNSTTRQGTASEEALRLAMDTFDPRSTAPKIIVLLSDGEDHEGDPLAAAQAASELGITLHIIGYGSEEGAPIPLRDETGSVIDFKADRAGNLILTRLEEPILQQMAEAAGGIYRRASEGGIEVVDVLNAIDSTERGTLQNQRITRRVERFGIFAAAALLLLTVDIFLPETRGRKISFDVLSFALLLTLVSCGVDVAERNNTGNAALQGERYEAALDAYQAAQVAAPDQPEAYYNAARAYLGTGSVEQAEAALEQAIRAGHESLTAQAYYNLGNVYFGQADYGRAYEAYRRALLINPDDADARYNLELSLLYLNRVTPTAIEQQTEPEPDDTDPTVTPTNQPGGFDGPTPTPPPAEGTPDLTADPIDGSTGEDGIAALTPIPQTQGRMTVEQAERLLDAVQQDQQTLREFLQQAADTGEPSEKDW